MDDHLPQAVVKRPALLGEGAIIASSDPIRRIRTGSGLQGAVPDLLQHRLDAGLLGDEVGKLVEHEDQRAGRSGAVRGEGQGRLPALRAQPGADIGGAGRRGALKRLDEPAELGLALLLDRGEVDVGAAGGLGELLGEAGLADPAPAAHGDEGGTAARSHLLEALLQKRQLPALGRRIPCGATILKAGRLYNSGAFIYLTGLSANSRTSFGVLIFELPRARSARLAIFARGFSTKLKRRASEGGVSPIGIDRLFA